MTSAVPETVMILAAGLGTRMRPLTDDRPKPLVQVAGRALIDHTLDLLQAEGVKRVIVNLHYRADMLENHLHNHAYDLDIQFSDERTLLLDSGGGLKKALPLFGDQDPIISVNGDLLWERDSTPIATAWQSFNSNQMDGLLVGAPVSGATGYDGPGDLFFHQAGSVEPADLRAERIPPPVTAPFYYAGIQILSRSLFDAFDMDVPFSVKQAWTDARQRGKLSALGIDMPTYHIGTPQGLKEAERVLSPI